MLGDFGEKSKELYFALDWVLSESENNSMIISVFIQEVGGMKWD